MTNRGIEESKAKSEKMRAISKGKGSKAAQMKVIEKAALIKLTLQLKRAPYESELCEEVAREYVRQQEEKQCSPADRAKDIEVLGSRMDDIECSVARLDEKMDKSHHQLESMLKLLLAKGVPTPPEDDPKPLATQEDDNNDVHSPDEDTVVTTTPETMPLPTFDTVEVADDSDALDADNEEESAEVAVQKECETTKEKTKVNDSEKPEQEEETPGASMVRARRVLKPAQTPKQTKVAGLSKPSKVATQIRADTGRRK